MKNHCGKPRRKASIERNNQRLPDAAFIVLSMIPASCGHHVRGAFHPVEPFLLDDAVDPLGDRVVGRLVVS